MLLSHYCRIFLSTKCNLSLKILHKCQSWSYNWMIQLLVNKRSETVQMSNITAKKIKYLKKVFATYVNYFLMSKFTLNLGANKCQKSMFPFFRVHSLHSKRDFSSTNKPITCLLSWKFVLWWTMWILNASISRNLYQHVDIDLVL